jgi:feruloyl-CoA synthase
MATSDRFQAPVRVFAPPSVIAERRDDGALLLRAKQPLGEFAPSLAHRFREHAAEHPERALAAQRADGGWAQLSWGDARGRADAVAQALLDAALGPDRPLMVLSGNSLAHLTMALGAHTAGVPVLPISTAYSLQSRDHERIRAIAERCSPGMVFADDADAFGAALDAVAAPNRAEVVVRGERDGAARFDALVATTPGADVERAFARIGPDTVVKLLFTSGSTGAPKGVINTNRMLCSNQQALGQVWPFLLSEPPVLVDWLPWSHTFGGNHNLGQVLAFGGSLYIDDGKPAPELFERTVAALRDVPPTVYYNVPAGYALLAPRLEDDRAFASAFFSRLRFMFYAAAALPEPLWERLRAIADEVADHPVPLTAAWGTTETAPGVTTAHFASARCGCIGVPLPGVEVKLAPRDDKLEMRVTGPNVTPGYVDEPELTAEAFDAEGYYRSGDAVRLVDESDPDQGLLFDGRLSEDFKLVTGTFVRVGTLRTELIAAAGVLRDAVLAGEGHDYVAALGWVDEQAARRACGLEGDVALDDPRLRGHLATALQRLGEGQGSASRVSRLLLLGEPPSIDAGEITDKGYVNQRAVLERRADDVERLFGEPPDTGVITPTEGLPRAVCGGPARSGRPRG